MGLSMNQDQTSSNSNGMSQDIFVGTPAEDLTVLELMGFQKKNPYQNPAGFW